MGKTRLRRRFIHGSPRMQSSSQSGESSSTSCRCAGSGETRERRLTAAPQGSGWGRPARVTPMAGRRRSREGYEPGRPGEQNLGTAGRSRGSREIWRELIEALPLERGNGATRRFKHGSAEGLEIRGNSMIRRPA